MRFIVIFIFFTPLLTAGQSELESVRISMEHCGGTTASISNCINSQSFDNDSFMNSEDVELLNSILNNSKYKKHLQAKVGPVNCAEFTLGSTNLRVAIICNDGICKLIDFTNRKEWRVKNSTDKAQLKSIVEKYWL